MWTERHPEGGDKDGDPENPEERRATCRSFEAASGEVRREDSLVPQREERIM